jgi:hypothetical protein
MTSHPTSPIDDYHRISLALTKQIRADIAVLKSRAAEWTPRPYPGR